MPSEKFITLRPARGVLTLAAVITAFGAFAGMAPAVAAVEIARRLLSGRSDVTWIVVLMAVALVVRQLCIFGAGLMTHLADIRVSFGIRRALLRKLQRLPLGWFTDRNSGIVKKTVEDDVAALHQLIAHSVVEVTAAVIPPLVSLVYLFIVDWRLALVGTVLVALGLFVYQRAMADAGTKYPEFMQWLARLNSAAIEFVNGIGVVKAFGRPGVANRRFSDTSARFGRFFLEWSQATTRASIVSEVLLSPPSMVLALAVASTIAILTGSAPATVIIPFVIFGTILTSGVMVVMMSIHPLVTALDVDRSITALLSGPELPVAEAAVTTVVRDPHQPAVRIDHVSYRYGETVALDDVSLELPHGTVTALVGPSGSGKSTLAKLLPRFEDPPSGSVSVFGTPITQIAPEELYRQVAFVFQDTALLDATVRDNIRLGRPDATDDEVRRAAADAQVLTRIDQLPQGLDTVVGRDAHFSGGEAQRICIARAILADRPILVLDEATAAADPENEARIQDALSAAAQDRTVLVIAHRLSTIVNVDQIAVLDHGRIVARGRHDELLHRSVLYADLWTADQRARTAGDRPAVQA